VTRSIVASSFAPSIAAPARDIAHVAARLDRRRRAGAAGAAERPGAFG
jgi:hypothetical protein